MGLRRAEASDPATIFLSVGDVEEGSDEVESSACLSSARRTATSRTHQREAPSRGRAKSGVHEEASDEVRVSELGAPDGDEHGEQDDVEQRQQQQPDDDAEDDVGAQQAATAATLVVH